MSEDIHKGRWFCYRISCMIVSLVDIEGNPEGILIFRLRRGYNLDVLIISSLRVVTIAGVLWENRFANVP